MACAVWCSSHKVTTLLIYSAARRSAVSTSWAIFIASITVRHTLQNRDHQPASHDDAWVLVRDLPMVLLRIACKTVEVVGSLNLSQWRRSFRKFSHVILGLGVWNWLNTVRIRSLLQRRLLAVSDFGLMSAILRIRMWDIVALVEFRFVFSPKVSCRVGDKLLKLYLFVSILWKSCVERPSHSPPLK
jgi:hypothetical protein